MLGRLVEDRHVAPARADQAVRSHSGIPPRAVFPPWVPVVGCAVVLALGVWATQASRRETVAERRLREAPICSEGQLFTDAECKITLDGTLVDLSYSGVKVLVHGRYVSDDVTLSGNIPFVSGTPVRVTLYRGELMHVEGQDLKVDTDRSPAHEHRGYEGMGTALLLGGILGMCVFVVRWFMGLEQRGGGGRAVSRR